MVVGVGVEIEIDEAEEVPWSLSFSFSARLCCGEEADAELLRCIASVRGKPFERPPPESEPALALVDEDERRKKGKPPFRLDDCFSPLLVVSHDCCRCSVWPLEYAEEVVELDETELRRTEPMPPRPLDPICSCCTPMLKLVERGDGLLPCSAIIPASPAILAAPSLYIRGDVVDPRRMSFVSAEILPRESRRRAAEELMMGGA